MAIQKKKKRFHEVEMPLIKKTTHLFAFEPKNLDGRYIKYDLTKILKGKNTILSLKVSADNEKATSEPRELRVLPAFMKKMVRKGTDYVEDSFKTNCKDAEITIKPFMVTRKKVSKKTRKGLREKSKQELIKEIESKKYSDIFEELLKGKLQKELSLKLKKIYPLAFCEIRTLKIDKVLEENSTEKKTNNSEDKKE